MPGTSTSRARIGSGQCSLQFAIPLSWSRLPNIPVSNRARHTMRGLFAVPFSRSGRYLAVLRGPFYLGFWGSPSHMAFILGLGYLSFLTSQRTHMRGLVFLFSFFILSWALKLLGPRRYQSTSTRTGSICCSEIPWDFQRSVPMQRRAGCVGTRSVQALLDLTPIVGITPFWKKYRCCLFVGWRGLLL